MRDAIIIGAGAGGPVVAKELAARGLDVLLLEAGARFAEPEWTRFENDANNFFRGLTDHFWDLVVGVMPFYTGSSKGPTSGARADFPGRGMLDESGTPPAFQAVSLALSRAGIAGFYNNGLPADTHGADSMGRLVGIELKKVMSDINRLLCIVVVTDDDVEYQNRVTLSPTLPQDEHGPMPRIELRNRSPRRCTE